jgi:hypothetical protein
MKRDARSSKSRRSSKLKTPKNVPCTPTGGIRHFFFGRELLSQQRVDQFKELSHWPTLAIPTTKQLPHSVADVTTAQSAIVPTIRTPQVNALSSASAPTHIHTHNSQYSTSGLAHPNKFKIALQDNDPDHPDAIIVTTLELDRPLILLPRGTALHAPFQTSRGG